jgi:hypothetical protein
MPFPGLDRFKASMKSGGARPNLFDVFIPFPGIVGAIAADAIRFRCTSTGIPDAPVSVVRVPYMGRNLKYAGVREFQDWSITIIEDEDLSIRRAIEAWASQINSHQTNLAQMVAPNGPNGYGRDAFVSQYGKAGNVLRRYRFVEAFPHTLGNVELSWQSGEQILSYQVTFAYQWWEPEVAFGAADPAVTIS